VYSLDCTCEKPERWLHFLRAMRVYRRAERVQIRLGNILPEVSGEISSPSILAAGTGVHPIFEAATGSRWNLERPSVSRHVVRRR
jgi:hypothetical protein